MRAPNYVSVHGALRIFRSGKRETPATQAAGAGTFKEIGPCRVAAFYHQAF
jgi:hypothetical protein